MTLTEANTAVSGSDSWAGQQFSVSGSYVRPSVTLMLVSQPGMRPKLYNGKALDANRIQLNGTIFYRQ
jgi:hypothetical protein